MNVGIQNNPDIIVGVARRAPLTAYAQRRALAHELNKRRSRSFVFCRCCGRDLPHWRYFCICLVCEEWTRDMKLDLSELRGIEVMPNYFYTRYN